MRFLHCAKNALLCKRCITKLRFLVNRALQVCNVKSMVRHCICNTETALPKVSEK